MKVRATLKHADAKFLFYDTRVQHEGSEFELLKEEDFDESCMEWVEKPVKVEPKKAKRAKKEVIETENEIDLDLELGLDVTDEPIEL
jgi:hypothetical protein